MGTISELLELLEKVDLRGQTEVIIENTAEEAIRLNQRQLYAEGTDANGIELAAYKWKAYADYKYGRNPRKYGVPDLYDEGNFFRGFEVELLGGAKFTITSKDEKKTRLEAKYGEILGLEKANEKQYIERVYAPALFAYIELVTGLKAE